MPLIVCPKCGSRATVAAMPPGRVRCPKAECREVFTPVAAPEPAAVAKATAVPPSPAKPVTATFFVRKAGDPDLVIGPFDRKRLDELINQGKFAPEDEFSADRKSWETVKARAEAPIEIDD